MPLEIRVEVDGRIAARASADRARADLGQLGFGDCAFDIVLPSDAVPMQWREMTVIAASEAELILDRRSSMATPELGRHVLARQPPATFPHIVHHFWRGDAPSVRFVFPEAVANDAELILCNRLLRAFDHARAAVGSGSLGMWDDISSNHHRGLVTALKSRDPKSLADRLRVALRADEGYGFGMGSQVYGAALHNGGVGVIGSLLIDRLAILAEAIGTLPHENPEQGRYGVNMSLRPAAIVRSIAAEMGMTIGRKPAMGAFGMADGDDVIDIRVPDDCYVSWRLRQVGLIAPVRSVGEIGGGFGGCAEFAYRAGFRDYTIYDIPTVCLLQGYYLGTVLGPEAISLHGEPMAADRVKILPFTTFPTNAYSHDIVVNRDSAPEIPAAIVEDYFDAMERRAGSLMFLSINQEGEAPAGGHQLQNRVFAMLHRRPRFKLLSRSPYWIRKGYVDELYRIDPLQG